MYTECMLAFKYIILSVLPNLCNVCGTEVILKSSLAFEHFTLHISFKPVKLCVCRYFVTKAHNRLLFHYRVKISFVLIQAVI